MATLRLTIDTADGKAPEQMTLDVSAMLASNTPQRVIRAICVGALDALLEPYLPKLFPDEGA